MWLNKLNILIILFFAFIIRLISLNQSLWWDEAINVVYARQNDFWWFVTKYPLGDFHPPGWFFILWMWGHLFGWSEISARMPSVFFGVATVYLTYLIGKELFSKRIGLLAAIMLSLAPLHIYYSQEARMYAFSAFAVSFSIYALILLVNKRRLSYLIFIFSSVLVLYSDYVAYFIFPAQFIYLFIFEKKTIKLYLSTFVFSLILYIPWIFILPQQLISGQKTAISVPGWKDIVGSSSLKELLLLPIKILTGRISFDNNILYFSFIVISTAPFLFILSKISKVMDKKYSLILIWLIIPTIFVWLFSYFIPIFSYFRLLFILPAFYIAVAVCLYKFSSRFTTILISLILIIEIIASGLYLFDNNFQREDWRGAVQFVDQKINDESLIIFKNSEIVSPFIYYSNQTSFAFAAFKVVPVQSYKDIKDLKGLVLDKKEMYVFNYLTEVTDPNNLLEKELEKLGLKKNRIYNFIGVGFITIYKTQQ